MATGQFALRRGRYIVVALLAAAALIGAAVWIAFAFLRVTPPRTVTMATDPDGTTSAELGKRYRDLLAVNGIDLRLMPSAGAVEDVARLRDPHSGVDIAFVPGGIIASQQSKDLVSLGTLFYEALWVFYRGPRVAEIHESMQGKRISVGSEGSGTRALAVKLLAQTGIVERRNATLLGLTPEVAAKQLLHGEIDGAIMLTSWESPVVRQLLAAPDINLANTPRADAWVVLYPFLNKLILPAGVGDMANNRPPADVMLIATKTSLVVRSDLHPAVQYLLLEAASQIHSGPGVFRQAGQFPAAESIDVPLSAHARQYYKSGPPFLQRHLPFWLAVLVQQLLVALIPLAGVLYPLVRFTPSAYDWAMERRVFKLYEELQRLEDRLAFDSGKPQQVDDVLTQLERLDKRASSLQVPVSFRPRLHSLRSYIRLIRQGLQRS
jgi:TRAP-type uncharacterized transport system substrate-binding protein